MAFIEQQQIITQEEVRVKIEKPVADDLKKYAEFAKSSQGYVVQEILRKVMKSDKDFQAFLQPDASDAGAKRGRKAREQQPQEIKAAVA